ncbi:MAG: hypothetical protein CMI03_01055 [Oceanospirillaceae bacterium]|uniref:hypothetical protein n=1 Tax=unclassified Thalassolituus TaxID=2624967 RepID=UPI000C091B3A|nr:MULTISPECIES: hypothetical protein [unclassified Thalassolituus]MAK92138.1 hypothetical protein [Thalassolituus sp.]MAS24074.1 hypothetical protein [Oceanospirillaceae bacterium]MBL35181.1 hypothetical protein [Oceanospirillaceae bacterium]MBS51329.1 hypothetical protein [Oceanospirillaceae bacterium]|tara:strand:+ start:664 stop:1377 length:714 start_codon:yes stop_codon:yes gene_type:complete
MKKATPLLLAAMLGLHGCASSPLSPTGEAVYYALQTDTTLRAWADACSDVSARAGQAAFTAEKNWWKRNGAMVEGADFGLAYDIINVTDTRVETGARVAMALTWQVVETAEAEVNDMLASASNKEDLCLRVLDQYNEGQRDLRGDDKVYQSLVDLQRRSQQQGEDLEIKRAAVSVEAGKEYGRSFYVVEKMAKRNGCSGAEVHLLKNAWPHEVYDASCPDGSYLLMRCEWGNCLIAD